MRKLNIETQLIIFLFVFFVVGIFFSKSVAGMEKDVRVETLTVSNEFVSVQLNVLFISIEKYELAPLDYASNDIEKFSTLLQTFYGCKSRAVVDWPRSQHQTGKPEFYRDAIKKEIQSWVDSLDANETGILYLAGHGLPDPEGKLCLPMINFNGKNFNEAAIPMSWIRETLNRSGGKCKLILLDTCFSGIGKAFDQWSIGSATQMAKSFDNMRHVTTLASSRDNQKSWIWPKMKHSLFTFWLIEAFRGNADLNKDRIITIDELFQYVDENVSWISSVNQEMKEQNAALLNRDQIKDLFRIPIPQTSLDEVIQNIASQIDLRMSMSEYGTILIPEFSTSATGEQIQSNYGILTKSVASQLIRSLNRNNRKPYTVFGENAVRELLVQHGIGPAQLGTSKTSHLKMGNKPVEIIVRGRLNRFHKNAMIVSVDLIHAPTMETIVSYDGTALLGPNEIGMTGASFTLNPRESIPVDPTRIKYRKVEELNMFVPPAILRKLHEVNEQQDKPHPVLDTNKPWNVQIMVRRLGSQDEFSERKGTLIENQYYVPLDKNEEYAIVLTNRGEEDLWAKVLVDGRNTISQTMNVLSKDVFVEQVEMGENVLAPRVDLKDAAAWMLYGIQKDTKGMKRTKSSDKTPNLYYIQGFYDTGSDKISTLYPFVLTDADEALRARDHYTDQIGLITVAFCKAVPLTGVRRGHQDLMTTLGTGVQVELQEDHSNSMPGELIAVCNIRYISKKLYHQLTENR